MIDLFRQLSDNQVAMLGCAGAIAGSLLLLTVSYHGNSANRPAQPVAKQQESEQAGRERTRRAA